MTYLEVLSQTGTTWKQKDLVVPHVLIQAPTLHPEDYAFQEPVGTVTYAFG